MRPVRALRLRKETLGDLAPDRLADVRGGRPLPGPSQEDVSCPARDCWGDPLLSRLFAECPHTLDGC